MPLLISNPASAVCSAVLNLPKQVGPLLGLPALAQAYRVQTVRLGPRLWVLAQNRGCGITYTAGFLFLYHKVKSVSREILEDGDGFYAISVLC